MAGRLVCIFMAAAGCMDRPILWISLRCNVVLAARFFGYHVAQAFEGAEPVDVVSGWRPEAGGVSFRDDLVVAKLGDIRSAFDGSCRVA